MLIIDAGTTYIKSLSDTGKFYRCLNKQIKYGTDVISRINNVSDNNSFDLLRKLLNESIIEHLSFHGIEFKVIDNKIITEYKVFIIGNSVIEHFFLDLDLNGLKKKPFSRDKSNIEQKYPYFIPGFYSFVGSDILPLLFKMKNMEEKNLMGFDFGTNCEIILKRKNRFFICSAPAGPAFENIVKNDQKLLLDIEFNGAFMYETNKKDGLIENILPKALIKLLYYLRKTSFIDKTGNMKYKFKIQDKELSIEKIRDFQKAKAAVSSSWKILKDHYLKDNPIDKVFITGNMISSDIIDQLKFFKIIPDEKTEYIENGLELFINNAKNSEFFNKMNDLRRKVIHIPQYNIPEYEKLYIEELNF